MNDIFRRYQEEKPSANSRRLSLSKKSIFLISRTNSLSLTPNPFPSVKGCVCLVGSASCRAFWHTRPASVPGLLSGAAAPATLLGASPQTPFYLYKEVYRQSVTACESRLFRILSHTISEHILLLYSTGSSIVSI